MSRICPIFSRRGRKCAKLTACALALIASTFVANQSALAAGDEDNSGAAERGVAAELSHDSIAGEGFLALRLKAGYAIELPQILCDEQGEEGCNTQLRLGLQAPIRLRIYGAESSESGALRTEDWDEFSDFLRLLQKLEYGQKGGALHAHIGELGPISLGHGTIVGGYYNVITTDHYQMGFAGELNTLYGGAEFLLDNVIDPGVTGARAYVRPWAFVNPEGFLSRVALGFSVVGDVQAPTQLASETDASVVVDDTLNPVVLSDQSTSLIGVDLEVALIDGEAFSVLPYADFTSHSSLGSGFHAGAFVSAKPADSFEIFSKLEYRRVGSRFLPNYIGPTYEIERLQFAGWGQTFPAPKVRVAASLTGEAAHGFYGSLGLRMRDVLMLKAAWANHEGPMNQLFHVQASAKPTDEIQVGVFYHKQYFDTFSDAFNLDGALIAAESRAGIWGPFYAVARYGRMWKIAPDGRYESVNDWSLGAGASVGF